MPILFFLLAQLLLISLLWLVSKTVNMTSLLNYLGEKIGSVPAFYILMVGMGILLVGIYYTLCKLYYQKLIIGGKDIRSTFFGGKVFWLYFLACTVAYPIMLIAIIIITSMHVDGFGSIGLLIFWPVYVVGSTLFFSLINYTIIQRFLFNSNTSEVIKKIVSIEKYNTEGSSLSFIESYISVIGMVIMIVSYYVSHLFIYKIHQYLFPQVRMELENGMIDFTNNPPEFILLSLAVLLSLVTYYYVCFIYLKNKNLSKEILDNIFFSSKITSIGFFIWFVWQFKAFFYDQNPIQGDAFMIIALVSILGLYLCNSLLIKRLSAHV